MGLTLPISWGKDGPTDHVYFLPSSSLQCAVPVGIQHAHSSSYYFYKADRSKASMGTGWTRPFATHRCVYQVRIYLWLATGGNKAKPVFKSVCLLKSAGLPWWLSGERIACQCRRHGFDPWSGRIPQASELKPVPCNFWAHVSWSLYSAKEARAMGKRLAAGRDKPALQEDPAQPINKQTNNNK